jgi:plastocyanin
VGAGSRLRYLVTLKNTGQISIAFITNRCPVYREVAATTTESSSGRYYLNCAGVSIKPGTEVTFEMFIDLPAHAHGRGTLTWTLDPDRSGALPGQADIVFM